MKDVINLFNTQNRVDNLSAILVGVIHAEVRIGEGAALTIYTFSMKMWSIILKMNLYIIYSIRHL